MKKQQVVKWFKEHEKEIVSFGSCAIGFGIGYFVSGKITRYKDALEIFICHKDGIIKFCNPATGLEVNIAKAADIVQQMYK